MIQRMIGLGLILVLAACGTNNSSEPTSVSVEATEAIVEATEADEVSEEATEAAEVVAEASEASAEGTEVRIENGSFVFELNANHETPMAWGGTATFSYPVEWTVRDTSEGNMRGEITLFAMDNYNLGISVNNDPSNTDSTVERVLNAMNQTATIESTEREGRTVYYTVTRGGNAWAAALYVEGTTFAFVELVNTSRLDLEPMKETAFAILLSVQVSAGE